MILTDAGPLVAILCRTDALHPASINTVSSLADQDFVTTVPCFAEAMHILYRRMGTSGQAALWQWWEDGNLVLHDSSSTELERMSHLMGKYSDLPMSLGDASLIAAAEWLGLRELFTFDSDFLIYRLVDGSMIQPIP